MPLDSSTKRRYRFGVFSLDPRSGELYKHGTRIKLQDQPFQVLTVLLERPGELVSREELQQRIWDRDTYVDFDHSLNISINKLREALGDSAATPRFIETLPRRGYRFVAPVAVDEPEAQTVVSEPALVAPVTNLPPTPPAAPAIAAASAPRRTLWTVLGLAGLAILISALWLWPRLSNQMFAGKGRVMLAVLPFQDLMADHKNDYFVEGLHDEMIAQLGRLYPAKLGVIARTSVAQYATDRKPIDQVGRDLHVQYVLDGTVRMVNGHFRITASLIQVSDQTQLWVETYEPQLNDILALQEDVAKKVSEALSMEFLPENEQKLRQTTTGNAQAYEAYLRGRHLWYQETRESLEQSIVEYQKAIALDPNYAPAYVGLADSNGVLGGYGFLPADEIFPKAKAAADQALRLAPNLSDVYNSMGFVSFYYEWDWKKSEDLYRKAIALNPNNQVAHEFYSSYLHAMGRLDEAEAENRVARELDPLSGWLHDDLGWIFLTRRRPEAAVPEFQKGTELTKFPASHLSLAVAYIRLRQFDKAFAEVHKAEELGGAPTRVLEVLGSAQALSGDMAGAQATVDKLRAGQISGRVSPYSVALIYAAMGRKSDALDWLEKGYNEKDTWMLWIKVLVEWDSLRGEPRFQALLQKLNLQT